MTTSLKLIPSRGPVHIFKNGDRIILKRGNNLAGAIDIEAADGGSKITFRGSNGDIIRTYTTRIAVTTNNLRQYCWSFTHGTAFYLEEKLCPNGAKAIPEVDDGERADMPGKYIIWCPTSNLPPRVVLESEKQARAVAHSMAERHGGEFFWCRLNGKVKRKAVTTYENVVTRL